MSRSAPTTSTEPILRCEGVARSYRMGESTVRVLRGVDLSVRAGEFLAIEGRSGSGKSTLLHLLGALDRPDEGRILFEGQDLRSLSSRQRSDLRNACFGFVFQFYHLLPELNLLENVLLPSLIRHSPRAWRRARRETETRAAEILQELGMAHRLRHRPSQLSGGERQRAAIARALMNRPRVLFADEPTGNLDAETGRQIMDVLEGLHESGGQTIVMVTHDRGLAREADRVLLLADGRLTAAK